MVNQQVIFLNRDLIAFSLCVSPYHLPCAISASYPTRIVFFFLLLQVQSSLVKISDYNSKVISVFSCSD